MSALPGSLLPPLGGLADAAALDHSGEPRLRGVAVAGLVVILACFGGLTGWSLLAHLDSAVVAQGTVVVHSHRKTVQHLEGGILRTLLVGEGEHVRAGQPLILLDPTQSDAQLSQLLGQEVSTQARVARLRAEQQGARTMAPPAELQARAGEPAVEEALIAQRKLFEARLRAYDSAAAIVERRILQFREQIGGAETQLSAVATRLALTQDDLRGATTLFDKGYGTRVRTLELQRSVEELRGQEGQLRAQVAQARQSIAQAEMEIVNLGDARQAEVAKDLEEARAQQADLDQRIRAARDVRERRAIVAPQDGVVTDLRLVTPGGVIAPGQPVMDIVPLGDPMIVEARVYPGDIEAVHPGLPAQLQFTAYKRTTTPTIAGTVSYVSADMLSDPRTGDQYFVARITPDPAALAAFGRIAPSPGMPAEVLIVTGRRRAYEYFLEPILERSNRAFREP